MSVTLHGTCKDSGGKAIPGVTVVEQETGVATQTAADGSWTMSTLNTLGHTVLALWEGIQLGSGSVAARLESVALNLVIDPYEGSGVQAQPSTSYFWSGSATLKAMDGDTLTPLPGFSVLAIAKDGQGNMVASWTGKTDVEGIVSWTEEVDLSQWAAITSCTVYWRGTYKGRVYPGTASVASVDSTSSPSPSVTYKYDNTNFGTVTCFTL